MIRIGFIIVAGGSGLRMGAGIPKQFLPLGGRPVLLRTMEAIAAAVPEAETVVVLPAAHIGTLHELCERFGYTVHYRATAGGASRFESVEAGLKALPDDCSLIAVHDGVRPLVTADMLRRGLDCARTNRTAIPVIPVTDTIREVAADGSSHTIDRSKLRAVQTPQIFDGELLRRAYRDAAATNDKSRFTDDASVVEHFGTVISLYEGSRENLKLTTPADMTIAEAILSLHEGSQRAQGAHEPHEPQKPQESQESHGAQAPHRTAADAASHPSDSASATPGHATTANPENCSKP